MSYKHEGSSHIVAIKAERMHLIMRALETRNGKAAISLEKAFFVVVVAFFKTLDNLACLVGPSLEWIKQNFALLLLLQHFLNGLLQQSEELWLGPA
jgi:hypothetical protein